MKTELQSWLFKKLIKAKAPITSIELASMDDFPLKKLKVATSGAMMRKIINRMRKNHIPVIANSKGYMIKYDKEAIIEQIQSLRNRQAIIEEGVEGLLYLLKTMDEVEEVDFFKEEV